MAIIKKVKDAEHPKDQKHLVLPAFSFATNTAMAGALAQMIVDAWTNGPFTFTPPGGGSTTVPHLGTALLQRDTTTLLPTPLATQTATAYVQQAGLDLTGVVVISEAEHDNNYNIMQSGDEIVLVLPDQSRVTSVTAANILQTAEFLMACTPNGI
jgi:hypothetical protein